MPYSVATLLARHGRNGDNRIGHLSDGDVVIPRERQERSKSLKAQLRTLMGDDLERFTVGSAWNSKNPRTGLSEFSEGGGGQGGSDGGDGGGSDAGGGGTDPGNTGGAGLGGLGVGGPDPTGSAGAAAANAQAAEAAANATGPGSTADTAAQSHDAAMLGAGPQAGDLGLQGKDVFGNDINARASPDMSLSDESGLAGLVGAGIRSAGFNVTSTGSVSPNSNLAGNVLGEVGSAFGGPLAGAAANALGARAAEALGVPGPAGESLGDKLGDVFGGSSSTGPSTGAPDRGTSDSGQTDPWGDIFASLAPDDQRQRQG